MRNPQGYATVVSPEQAKVRLGTFYCDVGSGILERDTFTCCHCNRVIHVKPNAPMDEFGSMCRNCMKMVCPQCADGSCTPFEKKLEAWEKQQYIKRQYAKL